MDRTGDIALKDNSYRELYDNSGTTGKAVAAGSGWVGLNDKADFYRLAVDADGIYSIDLSGIGNNVKFTLCEAVKFNDDGSVKSVKNVVSSTVTAENGGAGFENLQLSAGKEYYVVLQATAVDGKLDLLSVCRSEIFDLSFGDRRVYLFGGASDGRQPAQPGDDTGK